MDWADCGAACTTDVVMNSRPTATTPASRSILTPSTSTHEISISVPWARQSSDRSDLQRCHDPELDGEVVLEVRRIEHAVHRHGHKCRSGAPQQSTKETCRAGKRTPTSPQQHCHDDNE